MLRHRVLVLLALLCLVCSAVCAEQPSQVNVRDFGAKGDKVTDDTAAFQAALNSVAESGGTVFVPVGNYLINTHLTVPENVTLEGIWKIPIAWRAWTGSTLLAVEGEGSEEGPPFITLNTNSTVKGIAVFYPRQQVDGIRKYPWCIACAPADNASIVDCLLVNPYNGVDFGTNPSGRHYIRGLYGQPLRRGLFVDKCFDVGRVENVHFWPFWFWGEETPIGKWMAENSEAFIFGRTDWEYVFNTFCFGYGTGYRFIHTKDGQMNGNLLGIGADAANRAIVIEATQASGLLITNGEFVAFQGDDPVEVVTTKDFNGVVNFQNCAFWGSTRNIARLDGSGTVSFNGCNFVQWDRQRTKAPAIVTYGGNLIVTGCNFRETSPQIALRDRAETAVVTGNRAAGPKAVTNYCKANLRMGANAFTPLPTRPKEGKGAIVVDDVDTPGNVIYIGDWRMAGNSPEQHYGYYLGTRWAKRGAGEARAMFVPTIPRAGRYTVFAYFGPDPAHDHASDAPVTLRYSGGEKTIRVDLRSITGKWIKLGTFRFAAGRKGSVTFSNKADGNVMADAVKLAPAR